MTIWQRLLRRLGLTRSRRFSFQTDAALIQSLRDLAQDEQRSTEALTNDLLKRAIRSRQEERENMRIWEKLTPREQQVIALVCLDFSTAQIAARLCLSAETVKSHAQGAMRKYRVKKRADLRAVLGDWDFGDWEKWVDEQNTKKK